MDQVQAVLFDYSGTLFRLEEDEFVLSFELGAVKPDAAVFTAALSRLAVAAEHAVMVGDSEESDGGARSVGCGFVLVDPLPTTDRPDGLRRALTDYGLTV